MSTPVRINHTSCSNTIDTCIGVWCCWTRWFSCSSISDRRAREGCEREECGAIPVATLQSACSLINLTLLYVWMYQNRTTPLIYAARNGHLPVVEYLVEKGADMEATDIVSDVISLMWNHTSVTHEYMCVCECISMAGLHWYMLQWMVVSQWLNICWREELISVQRIE